MDGPIIPPQYGIRSTFSPQTPQNGIMEKVNAAYSSSGASSPVNSTVGYGTSGAGNSPFKANSTSPGYAYNSGVSQKIGPSAYSNLTNTGPGMKGTAAPNPAELMKTLLPSMLTGLAIYGMGSRILTGAMAASGITQTAVALSGAYVAVPYLAAMGGATLLYGVSRYATPYISRKITRAMEKVQKHRAAKKLEMEYTKLQAPSANSGHAYGMSSSASRPAVA